MPTLAARLLPWYAGHARPLPWREPGIGGWAVLVSEVMLQQTPVDRVLPAYAEWLRRWPTPAALAAAPSGDAVRQWGRLGYPRRALRLHAAARAIVARHGGRVPADLDALLDLPGVGGYTARAVASFAFGQRQAVVDTNVRRVVARAVEGVGQARPPAAVRDRLAVEPHLPADAATAAVFAAALMELGALVCTARAPRCTACPLASSCAWRLAGQPPYDGPVRRPQRWTGSDRQARGRLLALLRTADRPVPAHALDQAWDEPVQRSRALDGLIGDGLVETTPDGQYILPG